MKIEYMFDIKVVKRYYNLKEGATDRRLALKYLIKMTAYSLPGLGRLFFRLIIALRTNGITKSKAGNT